MRPLPPPTLYFFFLFFFLIEDKPVGRHFDTTEMTEAGSQAVLNTLTEHDFKDAFKPWQMYWEQCISAEGDYIKGDGGQQT
jgi:hypothetical protein